MRGGSYYRYKRFWRKPTLDYLVKIFKDMVEIFGKYWKSFLIEGLFNTLYLSFIAVLFGTLLGAVICLVKMSKVQPFSWLATAFIEIIRGTPMLLQLYIGVFIVPLILPFLGADEFVSVAITLVLNSAAYVSEIIRSGIAAVDKGQTEAARSLGLSSGVTMTEIVLPQAVKNILPALGNEFITVIKETSLAATFFVGELMTIYKLVVGNTHATIACFFIVGIIYFVLNFILSKLLKIVERKMKYA